MAFTGPGSLTPGSGDPVFWRVNGSNVYYSSGNVGIGTTTPAAKLTIGGTAGVDGIKFPDGTTQTTAATGGVPAGVVVASAASTCSTGWLAANGSNVSRTTYSTLFAAISTMYGTGDGSTTFTLPDYRGYFLRGWANGSTVDPDRASRTNRGDGTTGDNVGTKQMDEFKAHTHGSAAATTGALPQGAADWVAPAKGTITGSAGGNETRPVNIYVLYCIKT
ncbi:MAG: tail fiber protein [Spirochaetia bacterium]|nr:MAG: tail fiber protein [Spirochaetia bacterium]